MCCITCPHLNRSIKKRVYGAYLYGCSASMDGYTKVWINSDHLLEQIGCELEGETGEFKQMNIFEFL